MKFLPNNPAPVQTFAMYKLKWKQSKLNIVKWNIVKWKQSTKQWKTINNTDETNNNILLSLILVYCFVYLVCIVDAFPIFFSCWWFCWCIWVVDEREIFTVDSFIVLLICILLMFLIMFVVCFHCRCNLYNICITGSIVLYSCGAVKVFHWKIEKKIKIRWD